MSKFEKNSYVGKKVKDYLRERYESLRINKKDKILNDALTIKTKKNGVSIGQAIALAMACTIAGFSVGTVFEKRRVKPREEGVKESITCEVDEGEILEAAVDNKEDGYVDVLINDDEVGKIDLNVVDIYVPYNAKTVVNLRNGASLYDSVKESIDVNDTVYVNSDDSKVYNFDDEYNWKKALYEKDGVVYNGFVACESDLLDKSKNDDRVKVEVNTDAKVEVSNQKDKDKFENRAIVKVSDEQSNTHGEDHNNDNNSNPSIISPSDEIYESPIYAEISDKTPDREVVYGYKDVKITDDDVKKISNFLKSWENQALYNYVTGYSNDYYGNEYVNRCITEDKKNYICYIDGLGYCGDNGARNYGFGVMINQYGEKNFNHEEILEKKYGYNLYDPELLREGESLMPVEVIDEAKEHYIRERIDEVKACLKEYNIQFTKSEILALAAIGYQCGPERIPNLIENYAKYGNTKELRRNFFFYGNNPFEYANGATIQYEGISVGRAFANWKAFHDGELIMAAGKDLVVDIKDKSEMNRYEDREY